MLHLLVLVRGERTLEDHAEHSPFVGIAKDQDVERSAGDSVAVMLSLFDAKSHVEIPFSG
jgi:hypothetical protein